MTREQVEIRVAAEQEALAGGGGTADRDGAPEINSKFVLDCLEAEQLGDGILYAAMHRGRFIFAKNSEQWYVWDEHTWRRDDMDEAISAVEAVAMRYSEEIDDMQERIEIARKTGDDDVLSGTKARYAPKIKKLTARIKALRKPTGRKACLEFAHTNPVNQLAITGRDFDLNPYLLGAPNGVINLKTGELEQGCQSDFLTKRCGVPFLGRDIDQALINNTMRSIYDGDEEKIYFLQRLLGSALIGRVIDHVFPVLIGRGRNGKSLLIDIVSYVMGDYAGVVPAELLLDTNRPANYAASDPIIISLKGLRLAFASETGEGKKFSSEKCKWLTGGDPLTARGLYDKHPTEFYPTHLLVLITNHEPGAPAGDMAFWERCIMVRHQLSFVNRDPDPEKWYERRADLHLGDKLRDAGPAMLAWLVNGCLAYQEQGLKPPDSVRQSTREYQENEDYISQFIEAACSRAAAAEVGATSLYIAFVIWFRKSVNENQRFTPSQKAFGAKMRAREEFGVRKSGGVNRYVGLELTTEYMWLVNRAAEQGGGL